MDNYEGQNLQFSLPRRAIYAFCNEPDSNLFRKVNLLYQKFESTFQKCTDISSNHLTQWAGDVYKFGVHITLRGVSPVQKDRTEEWLNVIKEVSQQFGPIRLEGSFICSEFPNRIVLAFSGPEYEKSRLAYLASTLAKAVTPLIRLAPISMSEIQEMQSLISSSCLLGSKKYVKLQVLEEITSEVKANKLPPLPDTPEYRLRLLLSLWKNETIKKALFEVGDPYAIFFTPHISLLSAVDSGEKIPQIESEFSELVEQSIIIDHVYAMVENPLSTVMVNELDPFTGKKKKVQRPRWKLEAAFPLLSKD